MKSIQNKFIALIILCILLCSGIIGGAGILNSRQVVDEESAKSMNWMCEERAGKLDSLLSRIEQSVDTLSVYALEQIENVQLLMTDTNYMEEYTKRLTAVAVNAANNTEGALAVYVRFNPDFAPPTSGLFWSKTELNGRFQELTPTDFSSYNASDKEHVGWYYIPIKNGRATWLSAYQNENINQKMISYVIPLYKDNVTVGVVGMDIGFSLFEELVDEISVYKTGYAFLVDEFGKVMYHRQYSMGTAVENVDSGLESLVIELGNGSSGSNLFSYRFEDKNKKLAYRTLQNGMRLAITAPVAEIDAAKNNLIKIIAVSVILIASFSVLLTILFTRRLIRPLKELNMAAQKIAAGDFSVTLTQTTKDEVGTLSDSFQQTVNHLQKYIGYIDGLAYRDSLTGVKNKRAFQETEQRLEEEIHLSRPEFAVVVLDINNLKFYNDNYGHDFGDIIIMDACKLICKSFKHSPVYRIGGDEFAVILEKIDYENYPKLLEDFEKEMEDHNKNARTDNKISIARGIAVYSNETDLVFANVFKRADDCMYKNKIAMKEKTQQMESNSNAV